MKECLDCGEYISNHKLRCSICAKEKQKKQVKTWFWKTGIYVFRRWAKEKLKQLSYCCERCGNKIDATARGTWAGHHKDHNRLNNTKDNLEVLCKRCHQIEHECWTALQGVTTRAKARKT